MTGGAPSLRRLLLAAFLLGLAVSISLAEAALAGLAVVLLLDGGPPAPRVRLRWPLLVPMLAFAAWTLISSLAAPRPLESLTGARNVLVLGTFYVVLNVLPDGAAARRFALVLFALVSLVAVFSVLQIAACPPEPPAWPLVGRFFRKCGRARGFFSIYMTLAGVLLTVLLATLPRLLRGGREAVWIAPAWLVGVAALGLTYVRGAWIAFAAGVIAALALVRQRLVVWLALVGVVAALLFGVLLVMPGELRRLQMLGSLQDNSTIDRVAMIQAGVAMVRDHPILGVGLGGVKALYPAYAPDIAMRHHTSHLHNTPLQIAVERGLPGLLAWLVLFAAFFRRALAILRALPPSRADDRALVIGCLVAVGAFLLAGLFEYNFGDTEVLLVACSLMALPFVVEGGTVAADDGEAAPAPARHAG